MAERGGEDPLRAEGPLRLAVVEIRIYSLKAILKAAYNLTGWAFIHLQYRDDTAVEIRIRAKDPMVDIDRLVGEFLNDLIDQRLREIIGQETEATRDLILAHALSKTNLLSAELETVEPSDDPLRIVQPDAVARPPV